MTKCFLHSLVYSVWGHSDMLPKCSPGTLFDPWRGTVWILQRAVGAGHRGPCSCGPGPQFPLQQARLSPSSRQLPGGPGSSGEGKVGGRLQSLLIKQQSPVCDSEWNCANRRGRVVRHRALATETVDPNARRCLLNFVPRCIQNLFYASSSLLSQPRTSVPWHSRVSSLRFKISD